MKKYLLCLAACLIAIGAKAQKIEVVDTDGNGIPYASILTPDADYIGVTNLEGILSDAKGAKDITVSHVAFKTKRVKLDGKDVRITLEEADFSLEEITVEPKPFIYVQTYYRLYIHNEEDGIIYYRAGLTDNCYDPKKKVVTAKTSHISKAKMAIIKAIVGMLGSALDELSQIKAEKVEDRILKKGKLMGMTITDVAREVGFTAPNLREQFKRCYGITPVEYRAGLIVNDEEDDY